MFDGLGVSSGVCILYKYRSESITFCFRRLHDSQACAVRIRLSSGTLGRVMVGEKEPTRTVPPLTDHV